MKRLVSLLSVVLLSSCTKSIYHVASVQSEQVKSIENDFLFENEDLKVVYNLWEPGGRMRFLVYNKTDQPLYIDWSKSFLGRNDTKMLYSQLPPFTKKEYIDTVRYVYRNAFVEPYRITARANLPTEIPSQTYVAIADFPIQQVVLNAKTKDKVFTYTKENSPLRVGQQLTYSFDKTLANARSVEHSFWVDKIQVVGVGELTKLYGSLKKGQPNALYAVEKRPAPGRTAILAVGIVAGASGAVIIMLTNALNGLTW